eukprot:12087564-Ditylum_brightwellii.AAC.1
MEEERLCVVFHLANANWKWEHMGCRFGATYKDSMPKEWADMFLATTHTNAFVQHIEPSM